jgi:hypothetical protein
MCATGRGYPIHWAYNDSRQRIGSSPTLLLQDRLDSDRLSVVQLDDGDDMPRRIRITHAVLWPRLKEEMDNAGVTSALVLYATCRIPRVMSCGRRLRRAAAQNEIQREA